MRSKLTKKDLHIRIFLSKNPHSSLNVFTSISNIFLEAEAPRAHISGSRSVQSIELNLMALSQYNTYVKMCPSFTGVSTRVAEPSKVDRILNQPDNKTVLLSRYNVETFWHFKIWFRILPKPPDPDRQHLLQSQALRHHFLSYLVKNTYKNIFFWNGKYPGCIGIYRILNVQEVFLYSDPLYENGLDFSDIQYAWKTENQVNQDSDHTLKKNRILCRPGNLIKTWFWQILWFFQQS